MPETKNTDPHALDSRILTAIRHKVQDALRAAGHPRPPMSHLAQAVAAGFGENSHEAMLALCKEWGGSITAPRFSRDRCGRRLAELGHPDPMAVAAAIAAYDAAPSPPPDRELPTIDWRRNGRMISGSKSGYHSRHPDNLTVFNACVCTRSAGQLWNGDLDVTRDLSQLQAKARELGEDLYVLWESDGRRFFEDREPDLGRPAAIVAVDGLLRSWRDMMAA